MDTRFDKTMSKAKGKGIFQAVGWNQTKIWWKNNQWQNIRWISKKQTDETNPYQKNARSPTN